MDYLYFDIECCDGNHMCSFGYVITDADFRIIEKDDILIDPQKPFRLGRANFDPYVKLAYTEAEFRRHAAFDGVFNKIRALLTASNRVLLGHSVASDIKYLDIACKRYGKPYFDIAAYDTQKIYASSIGSKNMSSLEKIMTDLAIDISHLSAHKSCDDAEMTMLAVKALCSRCGLSIESVLSAQGGCVIDREKMIVAEINSKIKRVISRLKRSFAESRDWERIKLSDKLKLAHAEDIGRLAEFVYGEGYSMTINGDKFDYYVVSEDERIDGDMPPDVKILTADRFFAMINVEKTADGAFVNRDFGGGSNSLRQFFEQAAAKSASNEAHNKNRH